MTRKKRQRLMTDVYPEDNMPKEHLTTNKPNIYGGGGLGNFFGNIGRWAAHPFNKTARYNASVQSNPNSYGSGEITNFNTTGNGTTDWGSKGGFATGQTSQNNITNPYQGTTMMEQSFAQTGTPTAETVDANAFADISKSGKSEGTFTRGGGGIPWGAIISSAGTNIANALLDTEASTADRVATILGMPNLAKNWRADTTKGDANIAEMTNRINNATNRLIQDSNDTQGAFAAIKNNNNLNLIDTSGFKTPTLKDFKGKWWRNMGASVAQGAASGSVGGPWGAAGGAVTGLLGSIGGLFGRKKRAQRALDKYKDDMSYLQRFAGNFNSFQRLNQQQSNENLLSNGLRQQRIQDLANIRAYGGNLFAVGGKTDPTPSLPDVGTSPLGLNRLPYSDAQFTPVQLPNLKIDKQNVRWSNPNDTFMPWVQEAADYNANYINQRRDILNKNAQDLMAADSKYKTQIQSGERAPLLRKTLLEGNQIGYEKVKNPINLNDVGNDLANTWINNLYKPKVFSNKDVPLKHGNAGGEYLSFDIEQDPLLQHSIILNPDYLKQVDAANKGASHYYDTSAAHENYHSTFSDSFYEPLFQIYGLQSIAPEKQSVYDSYKGASDKDYWKRPGEILARRQEFRKAINLNPRDIVTKDFLNKPEVKKQLKENKLDYLTDDQLLKLFNNVADNTDNNQYDNVAAMGGQFDYNLSPNMIDLQNQSLANQKYKYNNQIQPVGFIDGGAGKIPNPGIPRLACGGKLHLNKFDYGGSMSMEDLPDNMQVYGNGGTHEENPNGGIQVGVDQQGIPNLVEQGEFRYGDYVFSDRINVDPELLTEFNLAPASKGKKKKNESYADAAKKMIKKAGDLNDPITKDTIDANMDRLKNAQEAQKFKEQQDQQLADYKSALKTPTQGNPMYGSMKYNGMGDVNQGLNEGVDSGMGAMDNSSLSNVNRSGNEMMAAYGGNLYANGSRLKRKDLQDIDLINRAINIDDGLPTYNQNVYIPNAYGQGLNYAGTIPMTDYSGINPTRRLIAPEEDIQLVRQPSSYIPIENPLMRPLNFGMSQSISTGTSNPSYTSTGKSFSYAKSSGETVNKDVNYKDDPLTISKDATASGTIQNPQQSVNNLGDLQKLNAQYATGNPFDAPSYNTFGRHAAPLKFLPAAFADRIGLTNFDYDPNLRPNQELKAAGRTGFVPRTADHSGMYRNAELFDINAANSAAQAQAAATARAMRNVNDRNQGAANQLAADYNAMLGIGNNYQTMFDANMKSRLATDDYNKQTEQTNVQANNDMYKDNQNAGIQAKQMELNTLAQSMADQTQKELYADKTNREAHDNIAGTQTALWNNTMQHLMDEAQRNDLYNKFNSDASQMWYYDKKLGKYVFKGDPAQAYLGTAMRTAENPVTSLDADLLKQYNDYVAKVGSQNVSKEFIDNLVYQQGQRNQEKEAKSIADRNAQMQSDIDFMNTQFSDLDNLTITDKDKSYKFFDYINSPKQVEAVRNFLANADVSQMNPNDYKNYKALLDNWMRMRDRQLMYRNQISPYNVADATNTTWAGQDNQAYGGYINSNKKKKKQYYTDI